MTVSSKQPAVLSVLGVVPNKIGGIESFARELSRQLGERGWRSVLCFLSPPTAAVKEYLDLPNVVLESLDTPESDAVYHFRLARLIMRYRPKILHLQLVPVFGPYAWVARAFGARKIFFTDQESRPAGFVGKPRSLWKRWLFRSMMAPLTRIFCVSCYVQNSFVNLGLLSKERTFVIYNGVDLDRMTAGNLCAEEFRRLLGLCAETFLVVQVGQVIPEKGGPDLIEAAARVCKINRYIHFLFVGDGTHLKEYREMAICLGLADKVTFLGQQEDPLGSGVFAAADLVCQVSRWEEAFGFVIAEAMAAARPVLATRSGGIPELVGDGTTGYLVERGDVEAMATRILELVENRTQSTAFGAVGQKVCRERFDHRKNVSKVLELYGIV